MATISSSRWKDPRYSELVRRYRDESRLVPCRACGNLTPISAAGFSALVVGRMHGSPENGFFIVKGGAAAPFGHPRPRSPLELKRQPSDRDSKPVLTPQPSDHRL